jgi:hypothetical protein
MRNHHQSGLEWRLDWPLAIIAVLFVIFWMMI